MQVYRMAFVALVVLILANLAKGTQFHLVMALSLAACAVPVFFQAFPRRRRTRRPRRRPARR